MKNIESCKVKVVILERTVFSPLNVSHIGDAIQLLEKYSEKERITVTLLPSFSDYKSLVLKNLEILIQKGFGYAMLEDHQLIGYIAGYPVDSLFGKEKGIFVPAFGHASAYEDRIRIETALYTYAAEQWVNQHYLTHSVSIFAHDQDLLSTWFDLGFGKRCVDAIRKVQCQAIIPSEFKFEEITTQNINLILEIHDAHIHYYQASPVFMPISDEDARTDLIAWLRQEDHRMFCIKVRNQVVGYIRYQTRGESLFSIHPQIRNITGLYVKPENRQHGIGSMLIYHIEEILSDNQIPLVGVDYESINPKANRFWFKHFSPYTYSLVRRIDERVL